MKASNFLQLSHRWVIKGSSAGASQTDNRAFIFFLNLFEQTYISRYLKKKTKKQKTEKQTKKTVLGRRGKFNKPTGVLDCEHKCQQTINKPGCLVVKTFLMIIFFFSISQTHKNLIQLNKLFFTLQGGMNVRMLIRNMVNRFFLLLMTGLRW